MKNPKSKRLPRVAALLAMLLLAGCVSGVPVSIENGSDRPLSRVTVSGSGFSESIASIAPGATETLYVRPKGETAVRVEFDVDGQRYSSQSEAIANDNVNRIDVKVGAGLEIAVDTGLR
jgi:hypothetical protein